MRAMSERLCLAMLVERSPDVFFHNYLDNILESALRTLAKSMSMPPQDLSLSQWDSSYTNGLRTT